MPVFRKKTGIVSLEKTVGFNSIIEKFETKITVILKRFLKKDY